MTHINFKFCFTFYPIELMSMLYGVLTVPLIFIQMCIDPIYGVMLKGDDIADAEFCPVQIGFAVVCGCCFYTGNFHTVKYYICNRFNSVIYTYIVGKKQEDVKTKKRTTIRMLDGDLVDPKLEAEFEKRIAEEKKLEVNNSGFNTEL